VSWTAPYDGGSAITKYTVTVRAQDGINFYPDTVNCPGDTTSTLTNNECTIPYSVLDTAPFLLSYNTNIYAKVAAVNLVG
jgi:hypothetical protein